MLEITGIIMESPEKKDNWFVRVLIVVLCIFVGVLISFNYFCVDPKGSISSGLITLLLILLVLILSESFDNFSLGKLFSVTREVKRKEREVQKLEKDNSELLKQLITISSTQNQTQQHTNVYGDYHAGRATVERASEQEVQAKETDEQERRTSESAPEYKIDWRKVEKCAMDKYISRIGIHPSNVIPEAKLVTQFHGIDPVSNYQPIFDGYYKKEEGEVFIEFRPNRGMHLMFRDRLYLMLSKLNHYNNIKNAEAHLDLVFMKVPNEEVRTRSTDRLLGDFEPAIASGLLRVSEIEISQEETDDCKREV